MGETSRLSPDPVSPIRPGFSYFASVSRVSRMPVCNKCGRFSNVLTVDVCEHCGAKDWEESRHDKTLREHGERYAKMTPTQRAQSSQSSLGRDSNGLSCLGGLIVGLFWITLLLGGLWLLVFVVKWMWEHS